MIEIPADIRDEVVAHAMGHFPNESCGLLAGSPNGSAAASDTARNAGLEL